MIRRESSLSDIVRSRNPFCDGDKVAIKILGGPKYKQKHFKSGFVVVKSYGDFLMVKNINSGKTVVVSVDLTIKDDTE